MIRVNSDWRQVEQVTSMSDRQYLLVDRRTGCAKVFASLQDLEYQYPPAKLEQMLTLKEADLFLVGQRLSLNYVLEIDHEA
jgi:hypothetical protein